MCKLIGFDGIRVVEFTILTLSTMRQNVERMGRITGESIMPMVTGEQSGETIILPVDFVVRETTKRLWHYIDLKPI